MYKEFEKYGHSKFLQMALVSPSNITLWDLKTHFKDVVISHLLFFLPNLFPMLVSAHNNKKLATFYHNFRRK
jgi:hypothetical protein